MAIGIGIGLPFRKNLGIPYISDLTNKITERSGFVLQSTMGNGGNILTSSFLSTNSSTRLIVGSKTRTSEKLFDGNNYTLFYRFKLVTSVNASGVDGTLANFGSGAATQRGIAYYINNNNIVLNISDGTTRYTPNQLVGVNSLDKSKWYDIFIEIDFDTKQLRSKVYDGNTVIGTQINQDISALVFNSNNNVIDFNFSHSKIAVCDFKKYLGLKTLVNIRLNNYISDLQIYLPDIVTGTDVSSNSNHFKTNNITFADYHYSKGSSYQLDYGYYIYRNGNDYIYVAKLLNGGDSNNTLLTNFIAVESISGNSNFFNLCDAYIEFIDDVFDRSNATIYTDEARLNRYIAATPKSWHSFELNRLTMNDYFNTDYKYIIFPNCANNSYEDRQYLKELLVYKNNKTQLEANSILRYTKDITINNMVYLKTPYTQVIKLTAHADSEFKVKINKGLLYDESEIVSEINAIPSISDNEDFISKFTRYFISNSNPGTNIGVANNTIHTNALLSNSYNHPECSGLSEWALNILKNYYSTSSLRGYYRVGDIICGTLNAMLWFVNRVILFKGRYQTSSLEEVQSDLKLWNEPLRKTANSAISYTGDGNIPLYERDTRFEEYTFNNNFKCKIPNTSTLILPVKSTNIPKQRGSSANIVDYANAIVTVPTGVVGIIEMPLAICRITGSGTIQLDGVTYNLTTDAATILAKLETYDKFYRSVEILTNTSTITIEYLLNSQRCLLFNNNLIDLVVSTGDVSVSKETTALIIPTFTLNVVTSNKFTTNNYLYHNGSKSIVMPTVTLFSSSNRYLCFYKQGVQTKQSIPIYGETTDTANSVKKITAGTQVIDQCFSAILNPKIDSFSDSLELSFESVDGSDTYYTLDGSTPDSNKTKYITPFSIVATTTIKWLNIKEDYADSHVNSRIITKL